MSFGSNSITSSRSTGTGRVALRSAVKFRLVSGILALAPWLISNRLTTFAGRFNTVTTGIKQASPRCSRPGNSNGRTSEYLYGTVHPCSRKGHINFFYRAVAPHLECRHVPAGSGCPTEIAQFIEPKAEVRMTVRALPHTDASVTEARLPIGLALPVIVALSAGLWLAIVEALWWAGWL